MLGKHTHHTASIQKLRKSEKLVGNLGEEVKKYLPLAMASGSLSLAGPGSLTRTMATGWTVSALGFAGKEKRKKLKES